LSDTYQETALYNSQSLLTDRKPTAGVIPITVEELSSADSDDSSDNKNLASFKSDRRGVKGATTVASPEVSASSGSEGSSAGGKSKLLLLQMASVFVEAEASRQHSSDTNDPETGMI
jgi:hypothetical protein